MLTAQGTNSECCVKTCESKPPANESEQTPKWRYSPLAVALVGCLGFWPCLSGILHCSSPALVARALALPVSSRRTRGRLYGKCRPSTCSHCELAAPGQWVKLLRPVVWASPSRLEAKGDGGTACHLAGQSHLRSPRATTLPTPTSMKRSPYSLLKMRLAASPEQWQGPT